jgi:hypothetical protein
LPLQLFTVVKKDTYLGNQYLSPDISESLSLSLSLSIDPYQPFLFDEQLDERLRDEAKLVFDNPLSGWATLPSILF